MKHGQEMTLVLSGEDGGGPPIFAVALVPPSDNGYFIIRILEKDPRNADGPRGQKRIPDCLRGTEIHVRPS
jgi:hypothetical protein